MDAMNLRESQLISCTGTVLTVNMCQEVVPPYARTNNDPTASGSLVRMRSGSTSGSTFVTALDFIDHTCTLLEGG